MRLLTLIAIMGAAACPLAAFAQSSPMAHLDDFGAGSRSGVTPTPMVADGTGLFWSGDDLLKTYGKASKSVTMGQFAWRPEYRLSEVQRPHEDAATAPSEMHEDKTQIYFIRSGTGVQFLGGKPSTDRVAPEGQHGSNGPLAGAKSFRIKPGDVVLIAPMTWHQTLADPGQTISYEMVHIETRRRMP